MDKKKNINVISLGCRLNIAEGEQMEKYALEAGLKNISIVNSCSVTERAVRKTNKAIKSIEKENINNKDHKLILTGCAVQTDKSKFSKRKIDYIIDNQAKRDKNIWSKISQGQDVPTYYSLITNDHALNSKNPINQTIETRKFELEPAISTKSRAIIEIQNGCNHQCSFCIIPLARGASRSLLPDVIFKNIKELVDKNIGEIVLSGVDISSYGDDFLEEYNLSDLIEDICKILPKNIFLRLSSIDCAEIDTKLFDYIYNHENITPYIHLSLQHGSDLILKRMKRRHSRKQAIDFCQKLQSSKKNISIGADLIAGFPTETEENFNDNISLIDECNIVHGHIFPFSARNQAVASKMPQNPQNIIFERAKILREKAKNKYNEALPLLIGKEFFGIIEPNNYIRLGNFFLAKIDNINPINNFSGNVLKVKIKELKDNDLIAVEYDK